MSRRIRDSRRPLRFNPPVVTSARDREALDQAIVRGSELLKQGQLDEAQQAFRRALELDPDSTKVLALLGLSYFRASKFADARPIYEELVKRAPSDASHRLNLGLVFLKLGQGDLAIAALEASRALDPSQGRAISYLGLAYARTGRYADAYRSFLLAGQVELAAEIEANLPPAEREAIHAQVGQATAAQPAAAAQPTPPPAPTAPSAPAAPPRQPTTDRNLAPMPPRPPSHAAAPHAPPHAPAERHAAPTPPADRHRAAAAPAAVIPLPAQSTVRQVTRAATQSLGPRARTPSAPPTGATVVEPGEHPAGREDGAPIVSIGPAPGISESQQFVLPNRGGGQVAAPHSGQSMVSMAVAAAEPAPTAPARTAAGGRPPRPLHDLATEELVRPDEGDDRFEIGPGGSLVIRVADRVLVRLEGVHVTGGDLTYELATRRTRGHQTEERFDHGGATLHVVSGRGYLIATPGKYTFEAVVLDDDILYLREDLVFAFESSLRWENGNVPGLRGRLPVVQFRGDGALALRLERPLVRVKLPPQGVVFVDAERLAGWIGRVIPRAVVPPTGGPMGTMCVECTGEGVVLVEPAPPASAVPEAARPESRRTSPHAAPPPPPPTSEAQPVIPPELADLDDQI
jgi:uncharacterized protein (AIM24 family)